MFLLCDSMTVLWFIKHFQNANKNVPLGGNVSIVTIGNEINLKEVFFPGFCMVGYYRLS